MSEPRSPPVDVLIVGAGPTGLVLALWLNRLGIRVRIIDKAAEAGTTSRALAIQARTLELYRQLGLSEAVVNGARAATAVNLWVSGRRTARAVFGELGAGISPFPSVLIFPQDAHERLLIERLANVGVSIERRTELLDFRESEAGIAARVKRPDGSVEVCDASFVAGCDGAHSVVRQTLNVGFPGGTYEHMFYVADIEGSGEVMNGELHVALDDTDFLVVFPLKQDGRARLVGTIRDTANQHNAVSWDDVGTTVMDKLSIRVATVNWFSTYRVHHRVAGCFRKGAAFLLGDAAHIHSPVGGQGMNTGIGDAVNLAWKIAAVLRGQAPTSLLDTYEPERIAFARRLVATTDRAFTVVTSNAPLARRMRLNVVPLVMPLAFAFKAFRRFMFKTVSQTTVSYHNSGLSEGQVGTVRGGDRLPWVPDGSEDNFAPLRSLEWQVHVYGDASTAVTTVCRERSLPLHVFPWRSEQGRAGLRRDALYLLRPDGYVALADAGGNATALVTYLNGRGLRFS